MGTQSLDGNLDFSHLERQATQTVFDVTVKCSNRATARAIADIDPNGHYIAGAGAALMGCGIGILIGIPTNNEAFFGLGGGLVGAIAGFAILSAIVRKK